MLSGCHPKQVSAGGAGAVHYRLLSRPTKPLKQQEKRVSLETHYRLYCSTCTFGATCERVPNICDQPPMRSRVASVVPGTPSTAICSGLPVPRGPAHPLSHGHQVTRDDLRRIDPGGGRAGDGSTQGSRPARRRGVEQAHARLSGSGAAIARAGRRDQRRVRLSRSEMPWLQHASDRCARHRAATEGNAGP